ncbi:MAG: hypothetical protein IT578_10770 [Verrucomicrobiae bacterium]|nr:hypothetical protein [Verrucomicrobiae bacterium]
MSWILLFSILGVLLVCLELFLPGVVIGVAGGICLALAVGLTYAKYGAVAGNLALAALAIASALGMGVWLIVFPRTRSGRSLITSRDLASSKSADALDALLDREGEALTLLRPAGTIGLDGRRVDAVAESGLISQGARIKVVRVEGNRVFVRKLDDAS